MLPKNGTIIIDTHTFTYIRESLITWVWLTFPFKREKNWKLGDTSIDLKKLV